MAKKKRTPKTSKGIHGGGGRTTLTTLQKALIDPKYLDRWGRARAKRVGIAKPKAASK
jgi:hypothetical protein